MDEKTKLYVFSKKEVFLIFLFMIVTAITSFVLGVKMGKSFSFAEAGLEPQDRQMVDIQSGQEEMVDEVIDQQQERTNDEKQQMIEEKNLRAEEILQDNLSGRNRLVPREQREMIQEKKKTELNKSGDRLGSDIGNPSSLSNRPADSGGVNNLKSRNVHQSNPSDSTQGNGKKAVVPPVMDMAVEKDEFALERVKDQYKGKFTIQLGSHQSLREAEEFAEGFKVRGYKPIIHEVELPNRGTWFRVSLGAFDTSSQAKDYVQREYSLFQGQDYVIIRFD